MADAPCMPLWVSDFFGSAACSEMDGDQQAFYLLMLAHSWNMKERGLPTDQTQLRRLLGVSLRLFRISFTNVSRQFYVKSTRMFHARVDEELAKVREKSKKASASASSRWEVMQRLKLLGGE